MQIKRAKFILESGLGFFSLEHSVILMGLLLIQNLCHPNSCFIGWKSSSAQVFFLSSYINLMGFTVHSGNWKWVPYSILVCLASM